MVTIAVELGFDPLVETASISFEPIRTAVNLVPRYELLEAELVDGARYRIWTIPLGALGVNRLDEVEAIAGRHSGLDRTVPLVTRVVRRSGHSTYRLGVRKGIKSKLFKSYWVGLAELGCQYNAADKYLIAVDVPPTASAPKLNRLLAAGEAAEAWYVHDGQDEHPAVS